METGAHTATTVLPATDPLRHRSVVSLHGILLLGLLLLLGLIIIG